MHICIAQTVLPPLGCVYCSSGVVVDCFTFSNLYTSPIISDVNRYPRSECMLSGKGNPIRLNISNKASATLLDVFQRYCLRKPRAHVNCCLNISVPLRRWANWAYYVHTHHCKWCICQWQFSKWSLRYGSF